MSEFLPLDLYLPYMGNPIEYEAQNGRVNNVRISLGYAHRGIEKLAVKQNLWQNLVLLERICGICTAAHTMCFCQALEKRGGVKTPQRGVYIRTLVAEIERIQSHIFPLISVANQLNLSSCLSSLFKARENAAIMLAMLTGKRVNYDFNQIGGVRIDFKDSKVLLSRLAGFSQALDIANKSVLTHPRLKGIGILSLEDAENTSATGPVARASGIDKDIRNCRGYAAYPELDFQVPIKYTGDVLARCEIRVLEIGESIKIIRQILTLLPPGPVHIDPVPALAPGPVSESVEAPRGENQYWLTLRDSLHLERLKIKTPTERNLEALKIMLIEARDEDVPLIVASVDPCYACAER